MNTLNTSIHDQMSPSEIIAAVLVDEQLFDSDEFALVCGVSPEWVCVHVQAGIFATGGDDPVDWRFSGSEIRRARQIHALERDFSALPELAALVIDLQEEVARLRAIAQRGR